jgi:hypothetical protein
MRIFYLKPQVLHKRPWGFFACTEAFPCSSGHLDTGDTESENCVKMIDIIKNIVIIVKDVKNQ